MSTHDAVQAGSIKNAEIDNQLHVSSLPQMPTAVTLLQKIEKLLPSAFVYIENPLADDKLT